MAETLSILTYGKVIGRFVAAIGDTFADGDFNPEVSPLSGQITFTAGASEILIPTASPAPVTMLMTPIMASLDINGYLTFNNAQGVYLIATNNSALNPTGFTWTADFNLSYNNQKFSIPSVSFLLPAGITLDLTQIAPVPGFSGVSTIQGKGVPLGGATGYVLAKASTADNDTVWVPQTGGSGTPTDGSVTTAKLADGSITDAKVASGAAIAQSKISGLTTSLSSQNPFSFGFSPTAKFDGTNWQSRTSSISANSSYTGRVVFDSADYTGVSSPTDMVTGDRWIRKVT